MATTTSVTCDKCGCTIRESRTLIRVETGTLRRRLDGVDLCETCAALFSRWLQGPDDSPTTTTEAS